MNIFNAVVKPVINGCKKISESSKTQKQIAKQAAKAKNYGKTRTALSTGKAAISGAVKPVMNKVISSSDSFEVVANTWGKVKQNVIKNSKSDLKNAIREIIGANDIQAATKSGGTIKGIAETGKAVTRLTTTLGLFVVGNIVPVPGASILGWVAGEKLANTLLGKPFTKQAKNLLK